MYDSGIPTPVYDNNIPPRDAYPAWSADRQIPLSKEEIEDVFLDLTQKFGFQRDSMRNMVRRSPSSPHARHHDPRLRDNVLIIDALFVSSHSLTSSCNCSTAGHQG